MTAGAIQKDSILIVLSKEEATFLYNLLSKADNGTLRDIRAKLVRAFKEGD